MSLALNLTPGKPYPLGATPDSDGVNFAIYSAHASQVLLCLFDASGHSETAQIPLNKDIGNVWCGYLSGITEGQLYGYRVKGDFEPYKGLLFNPQKLLIDPYAKALQGEFNWSEMYGTEESSEHNGKSLEERSTLVSGVLASYTKVTCHMMDNCPLCSGSAEARSAINCSSLDNAADMPKSKVVSLPKYQGEKPRIPWEETVIYECHVKGATHLTPEISAGNRGKFLGLAEPAFVEHLQSLGITTLELLPVQQFISEHFLVSKKLTNYWGYNTLNFFTPHADYLSGGDIAEFQQMVSVLHKHNIEVIIDVVYNHTAEGGFGGPFLSLRGIDNLSYYRLDPQKPCYYVNDTGCGNTIDINHPRTMQLVMDSMRYWVETMGVDGFRFDLATIMARDPGGFNRQHSFFQVIAQDPVLSQVKLIAEPWDIGPGGYQVGAFPLDWHEWNDQYRDTVRRFWRGDKNQIGRFGRRLQGSSDLFEHNGRGPSASINFITAHDGFTLADLVSYTNKDNYANDEENRDGHNQNWSANCGVEGPTDNRAVEAFRFQQQKNMLLTLLFSQGVPMIVAGSESQHSQQGNNNAYCQDNAMNWLRSDHLSSPGPLQSFIQSATKLRREFRFFRQSEYVHRDNEDFELLWFNKYGREMSTFDWHKPENQVLGFQVTDMQASSSLLMLFNASDNSVHFSLPTLPSDQQWLIRLASTSEYNSSAMYHSGEDFSLEAHSSWILSSIHAN